MSSAVSQLITSSHSFNGYCFVVELCGCFTYHICKDLYLWKYANIFFQSIYPRISFICYVKHFSIWCGSIYLHFVLCFFVSRIKSLMLSLRFISWSLLPIFYRINGSFILIYNTLSYLLDCTLFHIYNFASELKINIVYNK